MNDWIKGHHYFVNNCYMSLPIKQMPQTPRGINTGQDCVYIISSLSYSLVQTSYDEGICFKIYVVLIFCINSFISLSYFLYLLLFLR